jgi:hypothetical protein
MGDESQVGAIDSAAESDDAGPHGFQYRSQGKFLFKKHLSIVALDKGTANSKYKV